MLTDYHAKYYAYELSRLGGKGLDRLGQTLFDACVDLNPHQIEAAQFALRSPLSQGVLLADEVGLGKTIEAGLVLCQYWAEKKRNLIVITPASLRKQWHIELEEKFNLPCIVLDSTTFREKRKQGVVDPFQDHSIVICSMHFAASHAEEIKAVQWHLVVIDEAHKLRNAYRQSNRLGQRIRWATEEKRKLLLTATPLQNSLLELYGLSTLIDERIFADAASFRTQYINYGGDISGLRERLKSFCWRTLRSQVTEYVPYTNRLLMTRPFKPTEQEHNLYVAISDYLKREETYALPSRQKHLLVLLVRKVLASSPQAVAGTLKIIRDRLIKLQTEVKTNQSALETLISGEELNDELLDEILEDVEDEAVESDETPEAQETDRKPQKVDWVKLKEEIEELSTYIHWAQSIGVDTKSRSLLIALNVGLSKMREMGAAEKVVIFTESRRTQSWLKDYLEGNGYAGQVLTFNGTNQDDASGSVYEEWKQNNKDTGRSSGSRNIDLRAAIIDKFRDHARILIATEAGAEGLNLQFCSAIINFDLPWNPQRIEQRIGRCHRYGQKHDVVVINFLNERNEADRRVYELLEQKFNLFSGVFGVSDEVLGVIQGGMDFENRVLEIYQNCRTQGEIISSFDRLREELDERIQAKMADTKKLLLDNFDEDVHERLRINLQGTKERLDRIGQLFWTLTHHALAPYADFDDNELSFILKKSPSSQVNPGRYHLISKNQENVLGEFLFRLSHPLGQFVINTSKEVLCPVAEVVFDISNHPTRIALVERLRGQSGWLSLDFLRIESFDSEEVLLFSGITDEGHNIDQETCEKMFHCSGRILHKVSILSTTEHRLQLDRERHVKAALARNLEDNNLHFIEARDQLDKWADDMEMAIARELDDLKKQIRDLQRRSHQAPTMEEQKSIQEEIVRLEKKKRTLRQQVFDIEDDIALKRNQLLEALEKRMRQKSDLKPLFMIRWIVI